VQLGGIQGAMVEDQWTWITDEQTLDYDQTSTHNLAGNVIDLTRRVMILTNHVVLVLAWNMADQALHQTLLLILKALPNQCR
jgi:hypothetical protein